MNVSKPHLLLLTASSVAGVLVGLVFIGYIFIASGLIPANADGPFLPGERWAAKTSLAAAIAREAPTTANPEAFNDTNLIAGIKLYGGNCSVCHGAANGLASNIAIGLYQHAPQLGKHGVEDDSEGETFWKIRHGIRFTGMPSFGKALSDQQMWQLALFLKHMDALTPKSEQAWLSVKNPAAIAPPALQPRRPRRPS